MKKKCSRIDPTWVDRALAGRLAGKLSQAGVAVRLWDQAAPERHVSAQPALVVRNRRALGRIALGGELGLAEAYVDGDLSFEGDLRPMLESANRAAVGAALRLSAGSRALRGLSKLGESVGHRVIDRARARRNAMAHYDLGDDFFALWLDPTMTYTCAFFADASIGLADAQRAKMDLVCAKLGVSEGDRVVDAGCGWGGLALHMAERFGAEVRAYNVSPTQIAYARAQAEARGLTDRVTFIEEDYRSIEGTFDVFVSIGMLEAVGKAEYRTLGSVIKRVLAPGGRGLVHSIGRNEPMATDPWIDRYIFPGSYKPALAEMLGVFEPNGLAVVDVENLRMHYVMTLEHWLARFESHRREIRAMFDERFLRMWRLYLTAAAAAFASGWLQLYQVTFCHQGECPPKMQPRRTLGQ
jgi:cyclopropane-fatty-acyl-phospholipid synthase